MKYFLCISVLFPLLIAAQAPKKVLFSFQAKYKSASKVTWSDTLQQHYRAKFEHVEQEKIAIFKSDGTWVRTLTILEARQLMFCFRDYLKQNYQDFEIVEAYLIRAPSTNLYQATLKPPDGASKVVVKYSDKCRLISVE